MGPEIDKAINLIFFSFVFFWNKAICYNECLEKQ